MFSFLQNRINQSSHSNNSFESELAWEDKFDPNLNKPRRINIDLNNFSQVSEKDLDRKLMQDLESEKINYRFD